MKADDEENSNIEKSGPNWPLLAQIGQNGPKWPKFNVIRAILS